MTTIRKKSAETMAQENLERVVRVVGGTLKRSSFLSWGHRVHFRAGRYTFTVASNMIYASRSGRYLGKTCYYVLDHHSIPHAEWQASAILLLRNKPALFTYWKKHPNTFCI